LLSVALQMKVFLGLAVLAALQLSSAARVTVAGCAVLFGLHVIACCVWQWPSCACGAQLVDPSGQYSLVYCVMLV
jgi:hypothetical protein